MHNWLQRLRPLTHSKHRFHDFSLHPMSPFLSPAHVVNSNSRSPLLQLLPRIATGLVYPLRLQYCCSDDMLCFTVLEVSYIFTGVYSTYPPTAVTSFLLNLVMWHGMAVDEPENLPVGDSPSASITGMSSRRMHQDRGSSRCDTDRCPIAR